MICVTPLPAEYPLRTASIRLEGYSQPLWTQGRFPQHIQQRPAILADISRMADLRRNLPPEPSAAYFPGPEQIPRVVTRADAIRLGFTASAIDHRLATRRWHRVLPATYLTGNTLTWDDRLAAALAFGGPNALLTSAAALADLGLRCVSRPEKILLLVPRAHHIRPAGFVRLRRTDRMPLVAQIAGPRRAAPARAVADLALEWRILDDVRTLVSQAVRARLCSIPELWTEYEEGPHKHSANLRRAIVDIDAGAWSAPEARAASLLINANVPPFEQNARVNFPDGTWLYVDFLWRALRAVLEIDSDEHHADPLQRDRTDARHLKLHSLGLSVVHRRPAVLFREPARFQREMSRWLSARAHEVGAA